MTCFDCCYFWREEDEECRHCHWEPRCPDDIPPCEEEIMRKYLEKGD